MAFLVALSLFCLLALTGIGIGVYIDIRTERKVMLALVTTIRGELAEVTAHAALAAAKASATEEHVTTIRGELAEATAHAALAAAKASATEEHVTQLARNISALIVTQAA